MIERVVITGASGSIGSACVAAFHEVGAEVLGVGEDDRSEADESLILDLGQPDCGVRLAAHLGDRRVDVLVNNAAVGHALPAIETGSEDFDHLMAVNLRAPFLLSVALYPGLRASFGSIVNVGSVHAVATSAPASVYAASKGGLASLTRSLAVEWGPEVRVNCVLPGAVDSPMLADGLARAGRSLEAFGASHAVGRVGRPEEIADAIVFLATNRYLTGTSLIIDGGATARLSTE
jgi:NAD(P)-dependent dehydrogenase (short-subunit alcohol dehydrogenase family)